MPTPDALESAFWTALKSDMTMMVGLDGVEDGLTRPMTAQLMDGSNAMWFFTSPENGIVAQIDRGHRAIATFTSKGHDLFASVRGRIDIDRSRATIDKLWNSHVAAWYTGGKDDPDLVLLRLDPESAVIWKDASGIVAGIKSLLGSDPKQDYKDKVAKVSLGNPG